MKSLAEAEQIRYDAMLSGDVDTLADLLHPDGWYCHATGQRQRNAEWLDLMRSGFYRFTRISVTDQQIIEIGDVAVVLSALTIEVAVDGRAIAAPRQSTNVWKRWSDGRWKLLVYTGAATSETAEEPEKTSNADEEPNR